MYLMSPRGHKRTEKIVKTTVELPVELWQAVKVQAAENRSDLRDVIVKALVRYLNKRPSPRQD